MLFIVLRMRVASRPVLVVSERVENEHSNEKSEQ